MGLLYDLFKSNRKTAEELGFSIASVSNKAHMKRLAINSCIELISKTISQVEFTVKDKNRPLNFGKRQSINLYMITNYLLFKMTLKIC